MTPAVARLRISTLAIRLGVYVFFYFVTVVLFGGVLGWIGGYLLGITLTGLLASVGANLFTLQIFEGLPLAAVGLRWNAAAARNTVIGLAGGAGAAVLVLAPALAAHAAHFESFANPEGGMNAIAYAGLMLFFGAAGEELLFRGYGFQILLRTTGPFASILPVGILFAALHANNPGVNEVGLANTACFGILFGYAFYRSQDLWLPIGLHFGWNVTLPLFGVRVSGLKIGVTGYIMQWSAGRLWSGGDYGPEASILTTAVMVILFAYVWKAPVRRQASALLDPPKGDETCEPSPQP